MELTDDALIVKGNLVRGVADKTGTPVPDAEVVLTNGDGFLLNDKIVGISTPQLITKSDSSGAFKMRPLMYYQELAGGIGLQAIATFRDHEGKLLKGHLSRIITFSTVPRRYTPFEQYYFVGSTIGVSGQVLESGTNRPIEGAQIALHGKSLAERMITSTDKLGKWRIEGIPPQWGKQLFAVATHPRYGLAWESVQIPQLGPSGWITGEKLPSETTLHMAGMTMLKGRIVDETTGQTPTLVHPEWPIRSRMFSTYSSGDSQVQSENDLPKGFTETEIQRDGSFSLPVPLGSNRLSLSMPFFYLPDGQTRTFEVTEKGVDNVVFRVKKSPSSLIVKFVAEDPKDLKEIQVFDITTKPEGVPRGGDATDPYYMWGSGINPSDKELKVRIRYGAGKTMETTFVHSLNNWPQIVTLPAKPPALVAPTVQPQPIAQPDQPIFR